VTKSRSAKPWAGKSPLVRLHIGLEDVEDLRADLRQALDRHAAIAAGP
jgi:cystathionine beta-lyase